MTDQQIRDRALILERHYARLDPAHSINELCLRLAVSEREARTRTVQAADRDRRIHAADRAIAALDEALRQFVHKGHPGYPALQSGWVPERTVAAWREQLAAAQAASNATPRPPQESPNEQGGATGGRLRAEVGTQCCEHCGAMGHSPMCPAVARDTAVPAGDLVDEAALERVARAILDALAPDETDRTWSVRAYRAARVAIDTYRSGSEHLAAIARLGAGLHNRGVVDSPGLPPRDLVRAALDALDRYGAELQDEAETDPSPTVHPDPVGHMVIAASQYDLTTEQQIRRDALRAAVSTVGPLFEPERMATSTIDTAAAFEAYIRDGAQCQPDTAPPAGLHACAAADACRNDPRCPHADSCAMADAAPSTVEGDRD